ncbi:MAG: hypothetical protein HZB41_12260 [Ignavibacteriae bacterium]|nr:hypothetical protein [Ignavibacteriota bacterium]
MKNIILVDENIPLLADALKPCGEVILFKGRNLTNQALIESACNSLFVRSTTKVNSQLLENTAVNFIGTSTSGFDHIDVDFLKNNNINFVYAPGSNANSVAEYVVYSILKWRSLTEAELSTITIGIIGYGNIGKIIARFSKYLGLKILVNDPPLKVNGYIFPEFVRYAELDDLCKSSDIITNHVPLTFNELYSTNYLLNEININYIKSGSLFIHTSRGSVVNEKSLISKIDNDSIYSVIDVWENEPFINQDLMNRSIIATPHVAGYSRDGKIRGAKRMADEFRKFFHLEPDFNEINHELSQYKSMSPDKFKNYDMIYDLLKNSREIDTDTMKLKEIIIKSGENNTDVFDELRKNYPSKREIL